MSLEGVAGMPSVELYLFPGASSLAIHILLLECGVPFKTQQVTASPESQAALLKVTSKGSVPVLVLDYGEPPAGGGDRPSGRVVITETLAIATAICQLAPNRHVFGKTESERVRSYEWMSWLASTVHAQGWTSVFRPERILGQVETSGAEAAEATLQSRVREHALERLAEMYGQTERTLPAPGNDFAVGPGLTAVDALLYVHFRWAVQWNVVKAGGGSHPRFWAAMARLEGRPAVAQALREERLKPIADTRSG